MSTPTPDEVAKAKAVLEATVIDEQGAEVVTSTSKTLALPTPDPFDVPLKDEVWAFETIEFFGDTLNIRVPTEQAMSGIQLVGGKHTPDTVKANIFGLFVKNHLSPASYSRLFERLIDPEDPEYTAAAVGDLMGTLAKLAIENMQSAAK